MLIERISLLVRNDEGNGGLSIGWPDLENGGKGVRGAKRGN